MRNGRKLALRKDVLAELTGDDLRLAVGGEVSGVVCDVRDYVSAESLCVLNSCLTCICYP